MVLSRSAFGSIGKRLLEALVAQWQTTMILNLNNGFKPWRSFGLNSKINLVVFVFDGVYVGCITLIKVVFLPTPDAYIYILTC